MLLQYLRAMNIFLAETGITRLKLQFQQSFLHYIPCHDATDSKSAGKELSNEVLFVQIEQPELPNLNSQNQSNIIKAAAIYLPSTMR